MPSILSNVAGSTWNPAILAVALAMLAGCSLTPRYDRPELPLPRLTEPLEQERGACSASTLLSEEEVSLLDSLDGSGTLKCLAVQALLHNRDYRISILRVEQARAEYGVSKADRLPIVQATGQVTRQQFSNRALNEVYGQRYSSATISINDFELDFFERAKALSEVSLHGYLSSELGQRATRKALLAEVAQRYLLMRAAVSRQESSKALLEHRQKQLFLAQRQVESGDIPGEELRSVRVVLAQAEQQANEADLQAAKARNSLEREIGYAIAINATDSLPNAGERALGEAPWLANLSSNKLLERFDVQQAEEQLKASNASIGAARAAFFPSIRLSTGAGIASKHLHDLFSNNTGTWLFIPQINIPLFEGGRNQANLDIANTRKEISVANYEITIQNAFRDMIDGLGEREALLLRTRSQAELNDLAQEQLKHRKIQVERGDASQLEGLVAQIQAIQTEQALIDTKLAIQLNLLSLYRVLYGTDASAIPS
ncbi:efflux transporter outer membrane subunit [Pseudomonas mediterranea]|uniref:efflux transporter outer membrane subunit n=1 Tax=Pseudomonas mediterranea TaxID=183795 RepID=UPI0013166598|nr:efflux transporter outer membrane subunit [Pseudomonas mediterranea]QHA82019.1 efflux transporter outer membrane subunit [Pseudomonas mediterranea]